MLSLQKKWKQLTKEVILTEASFNFEQKIHARQKIIPNNNNNRKNI